MYQPFSPLGPSVGALLTQVGEPAVARVSKFSEYDPFVRLTCPCAFIDTMVVGAVTRIARYNFARLRRFAALRIRELFKEPIRLEFEPFIALPTARSSALKKDLTLLSHHSDVPVYYCERNRDAFGEPATGGFGADEIIAR